jgi:hypothetical protein
MLILFFSLLFNLNEVYSANLITNHAEVSAISERYQKNKIYQARRFGRMVEIDRNDLGRGISPYYIEDNKIKKLFKDYLDQCHQIVVEENYTYAYSYNCYYEPEFKISGYSDYERIGFKDVISNEEKIHVLRTLQKKYIIPGFTVHYRNTLNRNGEVEINPRQKSQLNFEVEAQTFAKFNKAGLTLVSDFKFKFDKFGYFPVEVEKRSSEIDLSSGDMLFSNGKGGYLIFKRFQPAPFHFQTLWISNDYFNYLDQIETKLFTYEGRGHCFYDDYLNPTPYDCKRSILNTKSPYKYQTYMLIEFDIVNNSINIH